MATTLEQFNPDMLTPAQNPQDARLDAVQFGASLIITKGQAIAIKASDKKAYGLNSTTPTNEVQTVNFNIASTGGTVTLRVPKPNGDFVQTVPAAWNATDATYLAAIQSALDTATGVVNGIVVTAIAATDTDLGFVLTYSGAGYAGLPQPSAAVDGTLPTSSTAWNVVRTTAGGISDGTQTFKGFAQQTFATDANGLVYFNGGVASPTAGFRTPPFSTAGVWTAGTFDPADLETSSTLVAEVDTFTATNPTTGDVYTITITYNDLSTHTVSATVGATQTATAIDALLLAAWNADPVAKQYATPSGTTTLIFTSKTPGYAMNLSGSVVGTGTIAKVVTTAASGASIAAILAACPGARILHNGFIKIP